MKYTTDHVNTFVLPRPPQQWNIPVKTKFPDWRFYSGFEANIAVNPDRFRIGLIVSSFLLKHVPTRDAGEDVVLDCSS